MHFLPIYMKNVSKKMSQASRSDESGAVLGGQIWQYRHEATQAQDGYEDR
jgi:hypothetical protein